MVNKLPTHSPPDFHAATAQALADESLQLALDTALVRREGMRRRRMADLPDVAALRELAGRIRQHTLDHLDYYIEQLADAVRNNGGQVHFAADAEEARRIVLQIARDSDCRTCVKSKSMTTEEIELAPFLNDAGIETLETDLGEFIVQISHDRPSHIVGPILHKDRASVGRSLTDYLKLPFTDDPATLAGHARTFLREKFRRADMGITGGNFLVARTGQVCVVENEGNARLATTLPRVLVSVVGIEKLIPRPSDLAVMLKLLTRSATGNPITVYTNIFTGPRKPGERHGPEQFHLVLLDNGRSQILASPYREILRCIRCGACLNICPVFRKLGGHPYGHVYSGPIGSVLAPLLKGLDTFKALPHASSLCGACYEVCPVRINIPCHLINLRRDIIDWELNGLGERALYRLWAWALRFPLLYRALGTMQKLLLRRRAKGTGWVTHLPFSAASWTQSRDFPAPARKTFRQLWRNRKPS